MSGNDALAVAGLLLVGVGLWLIWPPLAIIAVGACILSTAIGLAVLRHRGAAGTGDHEG